MPWSGSTFSRAEGIYSGATLWAQENGAGIGIVDTRHDTHDQDLATGINSCLHKGGNNSPTANINWGGFKITNAANGSARSDVATVANAQDNAIAYGGASTGAANTYNVTLSPALTAYATGQLVSFKAHQANTGAATININSVGSSNIKRMGLSTSDIAPGDINNDEIVVVQYDGAAWRLMSNRCEALVSIAAAGTTQGTATAITGKNVYISSGTALQGLVLPTPGVGETYSIYNSVSTIILVYPASGGAFINNSANKPIALTAGGALFCKSISSTTWLWWESQSSWLGAQSAAGTNAATATLIKYVYNKFDTVTGGSADGAIMPPMHPGATIVILNSSATNLKLYPATGEQIGGNTGNVTVAAGNIVTLRGALAATVGWEAISNVARLVS